MLKRSIVFSIIFVGVVAFGKVHQGKRKTATDGTTASDQVWFLDYTNGLTSEKMSDCLTASDFSKLCTATEGNGVNHRRCDNHRFNVFSSHNECRSFRQAATEGDNQ